MQIYVFFVENTNVYLQQKGESLTTFHFSLDKLNDYFLKTAENLLKMMNQPKTTYFSLEVSNMLKRLTACKYFYKSETTIIFGISADIIQGIPGFVSVPIKNINDQTNFECKDLLSTINVAEVLTANPGSKGRYAIMLIVDDKRRTNSVEAVFQTIYRETGELWESYDVIDEIYPSKENLMKLDGIVFTGSRYGVNENHAWLKKLLNFVKELSNHKNIQVVGSCFGVQLLAKSLGGEVAKLNYSNKIHLMIGIETIELTRNFEDKIINKYDIPFIKNYSKFNIMQFHADGVVKIPENSLILASSAECPVEMMLCGENMLGIQGHIEYSLEFVKDLINLHSSCFFPNDLERFQKSLVDYDPISQVELNSIANAFLKKKKLVQLIEENIWAQCDSNY